MDEASIPPGPPGAAPRAVGFDPGLADTGYAALEGGRRGLAGAHDHAAVVVDAARHRRHLRASVRTKRVQERVVVHAYELASVV